MLEHNKSEINKAHDHALEVNRLRENVAIKSIMSGEDFAAAYGLKATGTQQVVLNGATPRNNDNKKTFELLLFMGAFDQAIDNMLDDVQDILDSIAEHTQQAKQARGIIKSGNIEDATLYLLEHGYSQDDLNQMDYNQRMQAVEAEVIGHERTIDDLKQDYRDLLEETEELLKNKPHLLDNYLPRIEALQQEAKVLGIDFHDNVHKNVRRDRVKSGKDDHLLEVSSKDKEVFVEDIKKGTLVSAFNDEALGDPKPYTTIRHTKESGPQSAFCDPPPSAFTF